jgi:hypothetical protein
MSESQGEARPNQELTSQGNANQKEHGGIHKNETANNPFTKQDKKLLRKAVATAAVLLGLTACDKPITEGVVYKKEHAEDVVRMHPFWPAHPAFFRADVLTEKNEVYIAQCPTEKLPAQEKIKKECKTNVFSVPSETYNNVQIGQHYKKTDKDTQIYEWVNSK